MNTNLNTSLKQYLSGVWEARYFWFHLARAELKYKFRRSKLGLLWTMVNPLVLTLMMSLIFGNLFGISMGDYAPYIFSGLIIWEFFVGSVIAGSHSILVSEPYIKQFKHPIAIYPLKSTTVNIASFGISLIGLIFWILITKPVNLLVSTVTLPISITILYFIGWPLAVITSFTNLKYRDFSQIIALVMQLIWYMSPVFFEPKMFTAANLTYLVEYNPITHILNLIRAPLLYGKFPTGVDFLYSIGFMIVLYIIAISKIRKEEKSLVFYF